MLLLISLLGLFFSFKMYNFRFNNKSGARTVFYRQLVTNILFIICSSSKNNGAHLKAWSLNGAYSDSCYGGSLTTLSVSLWFNADGRPFNRLEGLVTYGDCFDGGPSYYIWLRSGQVCAGINTHGFNNVEICMPGQVSTVYSTLFIMIHYYTFCLALYLWLVGLFVIAYT